MRLERLGIIATCITNGNVNNFPITAMLFLKSKTHLKLLFTRENVTLLIIIITLFSWNVICYIHVYICDGRVVIPNTSSFKFCLHFCDFPNEFCNCFGIFCFSFLYRVHNATNGNRTITLMIIDTDYILLKYENPNTTSLPWSTICHFNGGGMWCRFCEQNITMHCIVPREKPHADG